MVLAGVGGAGVALAGCMSLNMDQRAEPQHGIDWYDGEWPPVLPDGHVAGEGRGRIDLSNRDYNWLTAVYAQLAYQEERKQTELLEGIRDALEE